MKFQQLSIEGIFCIELDRKEDERGFFARSFCEEEFKKQGLIGSFPQCNISFNIKKGTLRGLHYSVEPYAESKLVRCIRGSVFDVLVDLRPHSKTYLKWISVELTAENRKLLLIPVGIAHGFQTLEDNTELFYHMSAAYHPSCARGFLWNDPILQIDWPLTDPILSAKDKEFTPILI